MTETLMKSTVKKNRNSSDLSEKAVPILTTESELFKSRLKEVVGDKKLIWFAKECGFSDSLLGAYLRGDKLPGLDNLVAIANAGGVTVDWLATGRLPKTRAELRELQTRANPAPDHASSADQPADESELISTYRSASDAGKAALNKVATAIRTQSMSAWFHAGMAVSEAANVFEKKK